MSTPNDPTHVRHADEEKVETIAADARDCQQCVEYLAGWKRAQADYANLKREADRERMEFFKYANEHLLSSLLPAMDQFETALARAPTSTDATWLAGLAAVKAIWDSTCRDIGLAKIPTDGPFDTTMHEAIGEEEVDGTPEGTIVRVIQNGWKLHEKLLQPAKVLLAKQEAS